MNKRLEAAQTWCRNPFVYCRASLLSPVETDIDTGLRTSANTLLENLRRDAQTLSDPHRSRPERNSRTMMKATHRLLLSRKLRVTCDPLFPKAGFVNEVSLSRTFTSGPGGNMKRDGTSSGLMYVDFSIFKGKAALTMSPVLPKFVKRESGASVIDKKGVVMLRFMPAIGQRKYDPEKKQVFALSPTEVGSLISLDPAESCEFFHDPSIKSSLEGQVKKSLSVTPISSERGGYFFGLTVNNSLLKTTERISVPVTKAEFAVMRTAFSFVLPHIMGWNRLVALQPLTGNGQNPLKHPGIHGLQMNQVDTQLSPSLEWSR